MSFYALLILAFGMSMDAFAASIGKGAALYRPPLREALRTGIIFGVVEAITPVIGWGLAWPPASMFCAGITGLPLLC
jgi:putative Mn2+ efflux pump MntP